MLVANISTLFGKFRKYRVYNNIQKLNWFNKFWNLSFTGAYTSTQAVMIPLNIYNLLFTLLD